jgi:iron complex outermembrane receptor protein
MKSIYNKWLFWLLMCPFLVMAQQGTLTGIISEKVSGQPLPGANAIVKGTTNGATTDFDGKYTLSKLKNGDVIEFSYIGFKNVSLTYSGQKELNVALEEDASSLEEIKIVSIGYGTVRKQDATGAVDLLNAKDFNKGAVVTGSDLFQGKIAGVSVNTGGGSPGSIGEIRIRGGSSLAANNDPLVVLNGFPIGVGVLGSINPNDIESFSVLKDASATAIFGSRASNGVIMITTKKGGKKMQVEFNTQYGSGSPFNKIDVMNAPQFREAFKTVLANGNYSSITNQFYPVDPISGNRVFDEVGISQFLGFANTDWQDAIYRRTDFVENNLNIRGNLFNRIPVRLGLGNTFQEGLLLTDDLTRNTVNLSVNPTFFDNHLKIDVNFNYIDSRRRNAPGVHGAAIRMAPTVPIYDANSPFDGGFFEFMNPNLDPLNVNNFDRRAVANPVAQLLQTNNTSQENKIIANANVDYKFHFFPKLRWVTNVGYDGGSSSYLNLKNNRSRTSPLFNDVLIGDRAFGDGTGFNKLLDSYFVYNQEGENLKFDFTAGYSYQRFEDNGFNSGNVLNPNNPEQFRRTGTPLVLVGFFGRSNITFKDKYLLTLSYRRDGTSRFGPERRFGHFPALSAAWKIKEDLFPKNTTINELKLRGGWGITGQQDVGRANLHLPTYQFSVPNGSYPFGDGLISPLLPLGYNPLIQWEETNTYNLGVDFGLFNNRLSGNIDAYYKLSEKLFQSAPFADGTNFVNLFPQNIGSLSIRGLELNLNYNVLRTEKLNLNLNFNATTYRRRIESMPQGQDLLTGASIGFTPIQVHSEGQVPSSFLLYQQAYDPNGVPIDGAFVDRNGDNLINEDDRYIFNDPDPDFLFGFGANFSFYNFDLGFNMRANVGNHVFNLVQATNASYAALYENAALVNLNNVVTQTNFQTINNVQPISDLFVENASFLRMDYVNLGYTFQKWLGGKASLRLFTGVQNPFVITNYSGLDPELVGGVDNVIYPRQRQYLFGANVKF